MTDHKANPICLNKGPRSWKVQAVKQHWTRYKRTVNFCSKASLEQLQDLSCWLEVVQTTSNLRWGLLITSCCYIQRDLLLTLFLNPSLRCSNHKHIFTVYYKTVSCESLSQLTARPHPYTEFLIILCEIPRHQLLPVCHKKPTISPNLADTVVSLKGRWLL